MTTITLQNQFDAAHREYSDALLRYCMFKVSDREAAKDLVQETFFRAWRSVSKTGTPIDNMKAFLFKIANNLIIDSYRRHDPDESLDRMGEDGFDPGFDDTERWADSIDGSQAAELLKELREPYRTMLFLRYIKGFSISEIVDESNASKNTVTVRIHRGLHMLHDLVLESPFRLGA